MKSESLLFRGLRHIVKVVPGKRVTADISYLEPNGRLKGKKVIITGGGRGIGVALAEKFVSEGAAVLIAGRNEETLKSAAGRLGCRFLPLDVRNVGQFAGFISEAASILGGLDCLVNNAGISSHEKTFFDVTPETFDAQMETNLKGSFFLTQEFIRSVVSRRGKADVLFISSEAGETVDFRPYGFSKAAVNSMVKGLANLFAGDGIRVNAVAPGVTVSEMTGVASDGNLYYPNNRIGRVYLPEEVAETACFLLSDASGCISGQIITCNNAGTANVRWK